MRVLLLGAGGLLGRHLAEEFVRSGQTVIAPPRGEVAVEDEAAVRAAVAGCSLVVNAAGFTDVDAAEREPDRAFAANALGPENVARAAHAAAVPCVHVSTDFVFDGALDRPYDEWDAPRPLSTYARSKRAGELAVAAAAPRHHVVRVQGLYGEGGRNFASKLRALLVEKRANLRLDDERRVQPTWARSAARAIVTIAGSDRFGTWHACASGATTWHRFALALAARLGVAPFWRSARSEELSLAANRPPSCLLEARRMRLVGLAPPPPWEQSLADYLSEVGVP